MASSSPAPILVAEDDPRIRQIVAHYFDHANLKAEFFENAETLLEHITEHTRVVVLDYMMGGMTGLDCLQILKKEHTGIEVIMLTSKDEARPAIEAYKAGAYDYLIKPLDAEGLIKIVRQALRLSRTREENRHLRNSVNAPVGGLGFVGNAPEVRQLLSQIPPIAASTNTLMLGGESGTGKGVFARTIHKASPRKDEAFVTVSCPAVPRELLESELFGHEKGSFSGATQKRIGRVEMAHGGTLFLDEIGEMPLDLQPKLLNFLQDRSFFRIGGTELMQADVRVIVATNRNLKEMVAKGAFREDLYYRLNVLPLELPPLRKRKSDIPALVAHFCERIAERTGQPQAHFSPEALERLAAQTLEGNVRELENIVERVLTFSQGLQTIEGKHLEIQLGLNQTADNSLPEVAHLANIPLKALEKQAIEQTLAACGGIKAKAARALGITEKSIYNKMERLGIKAYKK